MKAISLLHGGLFISFMHTAHKSLVILANDT